MENTKNNYKSGYEVYNAMDEIITPIPELITILYMAINEFNLDKRSLDAADIQYLCGNHDHLCNLIAHVARDLNEINEKLENIQFRKAV